MKTRIIVAFLAALSVLLPGTVVAFVVNSAVQNAVLAGIEVRLMDQARAWRIVAESYEKDIKAREEQARLEAKEIVVSETKMAYELIDKAVTDSAGSLAPDQKEDLLNRMSRHTVGRTGYISLLDYEGSYVLSKDRARDGENILDATYDGKVYPAREIISIGKGLRQSEVGFYEYLWSNPGDPAPRYKITAIMHFPRVEWVLAVTAYYDDVIDTEYRKKTIERLKDLIASQAVGRSGYVAVLDSQGHYIVSLNRARDGEDISQAKDAGGRLFVREGIDRALAAGADADVVRYPWINPGEGQSREKIGGVAYFAAWDWVIWPSAYLDDFAQASSFMRWVILTIVLAAAFIGFAGYELSALMQRKDTIDKRV